jgi:hypothetical protein
MKAHLAWGLGIFVVSLLFFSQCSSTVQQVPAYNHSNFCTELFNGPALKTKWDATSFATCILQKPNDSTHSDSGFFAFIEVRDNLLQSTANPSDINAHKVYLQDWLQDWYMPHMGWAAVPETTWVQIHPSGHVLLHARFSPNTLFFPALPGLPQMNPSTAHVLLGFYHNMLFVYSQSGNEPLTPVWLP